MFDCMDKECGKDGCGGSCGICLVLHCCVDEFFCVFIEYVCEKLVICEVIVLGDICEVVYFIVGFFYVYESSIKELIYDYFYGKNVCFGESKGYGGSVADVVYVYMVSFMGIVCFKVSSDWDFNFYVVSDCIDIDGMCIWVD